MAMPPACVFGVFVVVILCAWEVADGGKRAGEGQRDGGGKIRGGGGKF